MKRATTYSTEYILGRVLDCYVTAQLDGHLTEPEMEDRMDDARRLDRTELARLWGRLEARSGRPISPRRSKDY